MDTQLSNYYALCVAGEDHSYIAKVDGAGRVELSPGVSVEQAACVMADYLKSHTSGVPLSMMLSLGDVEGSVVEYRGLMVHVSPGRVEYGPNYQPDELAKSLWESIAAKLQPQA